MHMLKMIAMWLLVIGGLAWAYEGFMHKDIFEMLSGNNNLIEMAIEMLMGVAALFVAFKLLTCKKCDHPHE